MRIANVTKEGKAADGFIIPAGSMFPLGCAIPNHSVSHPPHRALTERADTGRSCSTGCTFRQVQW
jgi:hypothetical protein